MGSCGICKNCGGGALEDFGHVVMSCTCVEEISRHQGVDDPGTVNRLFSVSH